jgi:hypothetical protein
MIDDATKYVWINGALVLGLIVALAAIFTFGGAGARVLLSAIGG